MRKAIAVIMTAVLVFAMSACGEKSDTATKEGPVAEKYHQMIEADDAHYYYEASVEETFLDEEDPEPSESLVAEGRDGQGNFVIMEGETQLDYRQLDKDGMHYDIYDEDKEYIKTEQEESEDMELSYSGTAQMEVDGNTYSYDEYQGTYEMEGFSEDGEADVETNLFIKRYLVDDQGNLKFIVYLQENGETKETFYQKIETITKLEEGSAPAELFEIPQGYKEVSDADEEELYEDEELSEEE